MQTLLIDAVQSLHRHPEETETSFLQRLRVADNRLTEQYRRRHVDGRHGYADPMVRAAYLLRYLPHYTLQLGDLLKMLEGDHDVARVFSQPRLHHAAVCGGPAPETIALAVLHAQADGQHLRTTVFDRQADVWADCWPISADAGRSFSEHPLVEISGHPTDLGAMPDAEERALLGECQLLTVMNALNELMQIGAGRLLNTLGARLEALPAGALILISDQANYDTCQEAFPLLEAWLKQHGARILVANTCINKVHSMENRFGLDSRLRSVYGRQATDGGPATLRSRIHNHQLQLAAVMPD